MWLFSFPMGMGAIDVVIVAVVMAMIAVIVAVMGFAATGQE